jgi:hypothetical protein
MLDKFLTGENVKVNGEIAGRQHILRTLYIYIHVYMFLFHRLICMDLHCLKD